MRPHEHRRQYFSTKCPQCGMLFRTQSLAYSIDPERLCPKCARNFVTEYSYSILLNVGDKRKIISSIPTLNGLQCEITKMKYEDEGITVTVKLLENKPASVWRIGDELDLHPYDLKKPNEK